MNQLNAQFKQLGKSIANLLHRYHVILFVIAAIGSLAVATFFLNNVIISSSASDEAQTYQGFDKNTIEKIDSFKTAEEQQASGETAPKGKRNPFVE